MVSLRRPSPVRARGQWVDDATPARLGRTEDDMVESARIVVGVDLSDWSRSALEYALAEATLRKAELHVVAAVPDAEFWPVGGGIAGSGAEVPSREQRIDRARESAERFVSEVVAEKGAEGVSVQLQVLPGSPSEVLVEQARGADLLVVGHRGRGGFASAVLGSVGLHCVLNAPCPVTVVRPTSQSAG
jgi:nucleotide-binding universal stress UspA family protein